MLSNWMFGAEPVDTLPNPGKNDSRDIRVSALGLCQRSKASHLFWVGPFQCKTSFPQWLQCLLDGYLWCMKVEIEVMDKGARI